MVSGRAEFANKDEKLYPNQFVNVHLLIDVREQTIAAPKAAVRTGAAGQFVYKVTEENHVVMQSVAPAEGEHFDDFAGFNDGMIEIASGLAEGDRVVVEGADRLRDGASVRISASDGRPSTTPPAEERPGKDPEPARERRRRPPTTPQ
jgi:multidrug efflux system membrane fusion protein